MKHSKLVPLIVLKNEGLPIIQIAELVINFFKKMAAVDANYSKLNIVSEKKSLYNSINIYQSNSTEFLGNEILNQNIDDIRKMDKVENPNIHFSMDKTIISFALESKIGEDTLATLDFCFTISKNLKSSIGSIVVNQNCFDGFEKAIFFLESAIESFSVNYSTIKVSDRDINKAVRGYKVPLGWITYFSNDYEIPIPDDLKGIEYKHTEKGRYLILTREYIAADSEKLETYKQKLLEIMEEIKRRVPEYSK